MYAETSNHTLFECPQALQVWALSPIPTPAHRFPSDALFTNMVCLFWNLPNNDQMEMFPWYIWKARNEKMFSNEDSDPHELIRSAEVEATACRLAHVRQYARKGMNLVAWGWGSHIHK
ncbi:unnamed protein product [Microthlaspi erraticum]|uniref:Reverse transcriptase zinc-binding domain-containing protein n=1 Tax=Microthlaspi erraticum TaxID=1685480 RepID=A0A6D2KHL5_9BRAS|nr:unnamed protein product [Microthlaspi erraticum]